MIKFFDKAVQDGTGDDGLPVYGLVPYFEHYKSAETHIVRPARDGDKAAYPAEWRAFEAARQPDHDGYPLAAWPQIDDAERKGLAERGIHTLERLIEADMTGAPRDFVEAQRHAKDFLEKTRSEGPRLAARIDELEAENGALKDEIADLKQAVKDAEARSAPKKGQVA